MIFKSIENKSYLLLDFLFLVQKSSQLTQVQQKLLVHLGVIVLGTTMLVRVRPLTHSGQGAFVKVIETQVLQFPLGSFKTHRNDKDNGSILPGKGFGEHKLLFDVLC